MVLNNYGGEAMVENMKGLLPSQLWGLRNQPPIGLFSFLLHIPCQHRAPKTYRFVVCKTVANSGQGLIDSHHTHGH